MPNPGKLSCCLCLFAALTSIACRSTRAPEERPASLAGLGFVAVGQTSKSVIYGRLGPPHAAFENDTVWTYVLERRQDSYKVIAELPLGDPNVYGLETYDLVLSFGPDGTLVRRGLIRLQ